MIKDRQGDYCTRVCDKCGNERKNTSYWNLKKKDNHYCHYCRDNSKHKGKVSHNKGKKQPPKITGEVSYISKDGYPQVYIGRDNGNGSGYMPMHRLIAYSSVNKKPVAGEKVHHIDGDKMNYNESNLFICKDMSHHRSIHAQLEVVAMDLVKNGLIEFDHNTGEYKICRHIEQFMLEKQGELLGSPNLKEEGNQQPSSLEIKEKVQRLFRMEVESSDSKRLAPEKFG